MLFKNECDWVALFLRVSFGGLMLSVHGYDKLQILFSIHSSGQVPFMDPIGIGSIPSLVLATFAEFLCSIFVIIGFRTRLSSAFVIITMLIALFVHWNHPIVQKELALIYLCGFICIALLGGRRYAITKS